jgi:hypothetical protein
MHGSGRLSAVYLKKKKQTVAKKGENGEQSVSVGGENGEQSVSVGGKYGKTAFTYERKRVP